MGDRAHNRSKGTTRLVTYWAFAVVIGLAGYLFAHLLRSSDIMD